MNTKPQILIIDDEPLARNSLEALLTSEPYVLTFAEDGFEGMQKALANPPDVILLDVMMPGIDGFKVCREIRKTDTLSEVPVILITTLDDRDSRITGIQAGADDFLSKPFDRLELLVRLQSITRLNRYRKIAAQREELKILHGELLVSYDKTIEGWSQALDLRDEETEGHTLRVTEQTLRLARAYGITDEDQLQHIWRGAMLHDVGKLGIPDSILLKPGKLTDEEWVIMRKHPVYAYQWLSRIPFLKPAMDIPYSHHEKWDGSGYPQGLKGQEIPIAARIFAIIDVWDAITSDRPYRKAMSLDEAYAYVLSQSGTHFDPHLVELFKENKASLETPIIL